MTKLDIWNAALGMIGHDRQVTSVDPLVDASVEATRCRTFWDGARRLVFASRPWQWLAVEDAISATETGDDGVTHVFDKPDDMLRLIAARATDGTPVVCHPHATTLRSDADEMVIEYVADDDDPTWWPPLICDAVAAELAARIAIPMSGNFQMSNALRAMSSEYVAQAEQQQGDAPEGTRNAQSGQRGTAR